MHLNKWLYDTLKMKDDTDDKYDNKFSKLVFTEVFGVVRLCHLQVGNNVSEEH
jgi:hypothetical protein